MVQQKLFASGADELLHAVQLIKSAQNALDFIADLEAKLRPVGKRELIKLLKLKSEEEGSADVLNVWDWFYYDRPHPQSRPQSHQGVFPCRNCGASYHTDISRASWGRVRRTFRRC